MKMVNRLLILIKLELTSIGLDEISRAGDGGAPAGEGGTTRSAAGAAGAARVVGVAGAAAAAAGEVRVAVWYYWLE